MSLALRKQKLSGKRLRPDLNHTCDTCVTSLELLKVGSTGLDFEYPWVTVESVERINLSQQLLFTIPNRLAKIMFSIVSVSVCLQGAYVTISHDTL